MIDSSALTEFSKIVGRMLVPYAAFVVGDAPRATGFVRVRYKKTPDAVRISLTQDGTGTALPLRHPLQAYISEFAGLWDRGRDEVVVDVYPPASARQTVEARWRWENEVVPRLAPQP